MPIGKDEIIIIEILKWDELQNKSTYDWFKVYNAMLDNPVIANLSPSEFKVWITLLSLASRVRAGFVQTSYRDLAKTSRVRAEFSKACATTLQQYHIVNIQNSHTEEKRYNRKKRREESATDPKVLKEKVLHPLADIWNKNCGSLPKVLEMSSARLTRCSKLFEKSTDEKYWTHLIKLLQTSKFHMGDNERQWRADFDFFIRQTTQIKLIEGSLGTPQNIKKFPSQIMEGDECSGNGIA